MNCIRTPRLESALATMSGKRNGNTATGHKTRRSRSTPTTAAYLLWCLCIFFPEVWSFLPRRTTSNPFTGGKWDSASLTSFSRRISCRKGQLVCHLWDLRGRRASVRLILPVPGKSPAGATKLEWRLQAQEWAWREQLATLTLARLRERTVYLSKRQNWRRRRNYMDTHQHRDSYPRQRSKRKSEEPRISTLEVCHWGQRSTTICDSCSIDWLLARSLWSNYSLFSLLPLCLAWLFGG